MLIHFWGVRGSLPSPLSGTQVKSKISAILERVRPSDLETPTSRERFLASLPPWLFGTVGGNTPCVEVRTERGDRIVLDAGSGVRELGISAAKERPKPSRYHFFFSHYHWDHLQGLPFFGPAYDPSVRIDFYTPHADLERTLRNQMRSPYFPIGMDVMAAQKTFTTMPGPVRIGDAVVSWRKMNHPGASYSFSVTEGSSSRRFIYATDIELSPGDYLATEENAAFFGGADVLVIDSQYTLDEAVEKYNWGHSAFSLAIDFASVWGIRKIMLFHHDPANDDRKLNGILQSARWYINHLAIKNVEVVLATEGTELRL